MTRQTARVHVEPITPAQVRTRLVDRIAVLGPRPRVLIDGWSVTDPLALATELVEPLRVAGRPAVVVRGLDFLRPASVRWEFGRDDPDALLDVALDSGALIREVLDPWEAGTAYLPALWDAAQDRSARRRTEPVPENGVLLLAGELLLGRWLPTDLTVHLALRPDMLARRLPTDQHWQLAADTRYRAEVDPEATADVVIRVDHAHRPGWVLER
ncbi:uridine kinase [Cellulomonas sp. NPDC089187]|uniref:uridine kinase n=1 Tax=Cellulomonas sp. NPDC089187 TaxID=3154970 RepID=UPI0034261353